jgi:hypothetical protein
VKIERLSFSVSVEITFSALEVDYLIDRAKRHYDFTCQEAGMSMKDGAQQNGFIAQLKLFNHLTTTWPWRHFDLALKIIEMPDKSPLRDKLTADFYRALKLIERRTKQLQEEEIHVERA